jgi:transcriptional regulator with XRE-family HTH domain
MTQPSLSSIENCKSEPTNEHLQKIAHALSFKFEELLGDEVHVYAEGNNRSEANNLVNNAQQHVQVGNAYQPEPIQKPYAVVQPPGSTIDWPSKYFQLQEKYESLLEAVRQQEQQLARQELLLLRYQMTFGPIESTA